MSSEFKFNFNVGQFPVPVSANQVPQIDQDVQRVAAALRAGGFACLFSRIIEPGWGFGAHRVAGFPAHIHFVSVPYTLPGAFVVSTYSAWPDSCHETEEEKSLHYVGASGSEFTVGVTYCKDQGSWRGQKFRIAEEVFSATGQDLRRFLIQMARGGIEDEEYVLAVREQMDLKKRIGIIGTYTFTPSTARASGVQEAR